MDIQKIAQSERAAPKHKLIQMNDLDKRNTAHSRSNVQQHFHDEYISSGICNYLHGERNNKTTGHINDTFKQLMDILGK